MTAGGHLRMSANPYNPEPTALSLDTPPEEVLKTAAESSTYSQILTSSALIAGSSVLNIGIGIVRTKAMALLLGPAGFGLFGLYGSIANLAQSIAGMGINSSGVRQIAEAVGSEDIERIAQTAIVLRRTSILLGTLGAALLIVSSRQVSILTFGNSHNAAGVSLLGLAVFFSLVSNGQGALIQGMRRISDLAKMGILGAFFGLLVTLPTVYFLREHGVVPSLVGVAAMTVITSWWYSRKIPIHSVSIAASEVRREAAALLKLGFAFMASGFMTMGSAYAVRVIVLHRVGLEATGLYQSSWSLGGLYVGFILQAMGADFYPRLTVSANNNTKTNRLVNEQARVSLLLAGPGVIATLTFAPLIIALFYSAKFHAAVELLRWICLGTTLQVLTWPMGFIIVAKGKQAIFFWCELAWTVVSLGLAWICVGLFGLNGAGIAFFGSYLFHGLLIYPIVHQLSAFRWSIENIRTGLGFLSLIAVVFTGFHVLPFLLAELLGVAAAVLSGAYSLRMLLRLTTLDWLPAPLRRMAGRCRGLDTSKYS
jgi:enterobacterial common antigen flippase